jgi:SAM-dependent methyltransferase
MPDQRAGADVLELRGDLEPRPRWRSARLCMIAPSTAATASAASHFTPATGPSIASVSAPASLDFYDVELRAHHEHLRAAYGICPGDEVVDVGCGTGLTTREAARAAAPGCVVGVDVSEHMLERARHMTAAARLDNVGYELGDAQLHPAGPSGPVGRISVDAVDSAISGAVQARCGRVGALTSLVRLRLVSTRRMSRR